MATPTDANDIVLRIVQKVVADVGSTRASSEQIKKAILSVQDDLVGELNRTIADPNTSLEQARAEISHLQGLIKELRGLQVGETLKNRVGNLQIPGGSGKFVDKNGNPIYGTRTLTRLANKSVREIQGSVEGYVDSFRTRVNAISKEGLAKRSPVFSQFGVTDQDIDENTPRARAVRKLVNQQTTAGTNAAILGDEALSAAFAQAAADVKQTNAQLKANTLKVLASSDAYGKSLAETTRTQAKINADKLTELASTDEYAKSLAVAARQQAQINTAKLRELASTTDHAKELAEAQLLQGKINNQKKRELVEGGAGRQSARAKALDRQLKTQEATSLRSASNLSIFGAGQRADAELAARRAVRAAGDEKLIKLQAEEAAATKLANAKKQEKILSEARYIQAVELEAQTALESAAIKKKAALTAATSVGGAEARRVALEAEGALLVQKQVESQFKRVVQLQTLLGLADAEIAVSRGDVQAALEGRNLQNTLNALDAELIALKQRAIAQGIAPGQIPGGVRGTAPTGGQQQQAGGLGLGQGFRSAIRFGVASTVIYGLARGVSEAVREASELERVLNQVRRQFESQFVSGGQREFEQFRDAVFETAKLTGQAADEVASVGFQLQGAFGGNTVRAIQETRDAIIAVRVTGLELKEVIDAFTALTQNFAEADLTIAQVSDTALVLQENLGVLAKETISFAADLAPVAAALGFTADQLATLGAVSQKFSGRSGASLAEAFGRVLPQIQESGIEVTEIFSTLGDAVTQDLNQAFASGNVDDAFNTIIGNYNRLSQTQKNAVIDLLGGRREAAAIIPVLENGQAVLNEYAKTAESEGKSIEYFNDLQDTLQQRLARVGEEFRHLVQQFFDSGLKDFFADFIDLLSTTIRLVDFLVDSLGSMLAVLGPIAPALGPLLQVGALYGTFAFGRTAVRGFRGRDGGGGDPASSVATASLFSGGRKGFVEQGQRLATSARAGLQEGVRANISRARGAVFTPLGAAIGFALFSALDNEIRKRSEAEIAKFAAGGVSPGEERNLSRRIGRDTSSQRVLSLLEQGFSAEEIKRRLGNAAENNASGFQQFLDALPGELSQEINVEQGQVDVLVDGVAEKFNAALAESFNNFRNADTSEQEDITRRVQEFVREQLEASLEPVAVDYDPILDEVTYGDELVVPREIQEIADLINEGLAAGDDIATIFESIDTSDYGDQAARFAGAARDFFLSIKTQGAKDAEVLEEGILAYEVAAAGYEAGTVNIIEYERAQRRYLNILRGQAVGNPDTQIELQKEISKEQDRQFQLLERGEIASVTGIGDITGRPDFDRIESRYQEALTSGEFSIEQQAEIAKQLIENRRNRAAFLADQAEREGREADAAAIRARELAVTDDEASAILADNLASQAEFQRAMGEYANGNQTVVNDLTQSIADLVVTQSLSLADASRQVVRNSIEAQRRVAAAQRQAERIARAAEDVVTRAANALRASFGFGGKTQADPFAGGNPYAGRGGTAEGGGSLEDQIEREVQALVGSVGDFDASFPTSAEGPGGGRSAASDTTDDLARRIAEARLDYALALAEGDPVAEARIAQRQADLAFQYAEDEAEQISAEAARIRADRTLQEAIFEISNSQIGLLIAMADAAGETVEAARLGIRAVEEQIAQANALGVGEAGLNELEAQLVTAEAGARDALLSDRGEYFRYLAAVGKISQGQLIGYLQTLQAIPNLTEKQRRDLEVEIYNLRQSLGQDFQFNLPSNLALPTLYEARRFDQSNPLDGGVGGYNDNRQISVTVNAQTGADPEQIANLVVAAVGDPSRNGTLPKRYP